MFVCECAHACAYACVCIHFYLKSPLSRLLTDQSFVGEQFTETNLGDPDEGEWFSDTEPTVSAHKNTHKHKYTHTYLHASSSKRQVLMKCVFMPSLDSTVIVS